MLNEHQKLWNNMLLLENNATGSNRYRNRGGQLLKEEKERNKLAKKIPLIEQQLLEMAEEFQSETGRVFLTYGATVEEYIAHLHNLRENVSKIRDSIKAVAPRGASISYYSMRTNTRHCKLNFIGAIYLSY